MEKGSEPAEPESMNAPEPALTKSDVISLEEYWAALKTERGDEPFTLEEIYLNCVELFKKEQTVVFQSAGFVQLLYDLKNTDYIPDDFELPAPFKQYLITTNPEKISETDVYAVFVASLENCFKDDIYYSDYDYDSKTRNIGKSCSLWFSTEYRVLGYDSYTEYTKALGRRECDVILTATMVSFREPAVCIFTDEYADLQHYESFRSAVEDIGVEFK
ncbi:MAG: hypothetical protein J5760_02265 [Clostridia bacterium]|nr:hypothetical protein [Clostridia bacterium]